PQNVRPLRTVWSGSRVRRPTVWAVTGVSMITCFAMVSSTVPTARTRTGCRVCFTRRFSSRLLISGKQKRIWMYWLTRCSDGPEVDTNYH
ncbi:unnamed protein product, partial [Medioppia subpectinata]